MKTIERFPHTWAETDDCWIPMPDGARLAAKLWLPDMARSRRVPAIIEVLPYRSRDISAPRDAMHHRYFAGHGYACLRVDIRGSGDSDGHQGVFAMRQEQDDTLSVLEWIAAQPWSDGQVGMFGLSWGGFQAIQTAYRSPAQLKAIVPCSFAPDRYIYSQVYRGGCVLLRSIRWSTQMMGYKSRPPDPRRVGERWRAMWLERLEHDAPQVIAALEHQAHDAYWKSRAIDFGRIRCPVYAASGWADGAYVGAVGEALAKLDVPRRGLIGAWGHRFPHLGVPGPAVGFLQETLRWFDQWMRGRDSGMLREPMLTAWMAGPVPAKPFYAQSPGRWVVEATWPSPRIEPMRLALNASGRLAARAGKVSRVQWRSPQTLGLECGELMPWFQHGESAELPGDQRADDGKSLVFDSDPLPRRLEILGAPIATLELAVDRPAAFICVRLCDVATDGTSARATYGVLNLTHLAGAERPTPLVPGKRYRVRVPLTPAGYAFERGHRIRVALSTTYWPLIWPSPAPVTLTLFTGKSSIELPRRPPLRADQAVRFPRLEAAPPAARTVLTTGGRRRSIHTDVGTGDTVVEIDDRGGRIRYDEIDLIAEARSTERYSVREDDPLRASAAMDCQWEFERGDWRIRTLCSTTVTCTARHFVIAARVAGFEGEARVFDRSFDQRVARKGN
ncbi:MAG: CocE/NonD family hydrolase [Burkholderiales bacterium]|nr:CocE/NonD family hydrolase [Burkholderiales bacterium]